MVCFASRLDVSTAVTSNVWVPLVTVVVAEYGEELSEPISCPSSLNTTLCIAILSDAFAEKVKMILRELEYLSLVDW